jgi:hypothetical protein
MHNPLAKLAAKLLSLSLSLTHTHTHTHTQTQTHIRAYTRHAGVKLGFVVWGDGTMIFTKRMRHKRLAFRLHQRNSVRLGHGHVGNWFYRKGGGCARKLTVVREVHGESSFIVLSLTPFLARLVL